MQKYLDLLISRYPELAVVRESVALTSQAIVDAYRAGGKVLTAGNGGSAADADHITGELLKGFVMRRPLDAELKKRFEDHWGEDGTKLAGELQMGLPAVNLGNAQALLSAFANDVSPESSIAQHLWALAKPGDVFIGISTGGGAENIRRALMASRAAGVKSVLLTGNKHGRCEEYADIVIAAPERETYKIQELHLAIYHTICLIVEGAFFNE